MAPWYFCVPLKKEGVVKENGMGRKKKTGKQEKREDGIGVRGRGKKRKREKNINKDIMGQCLGEKLHGIVGARHIACALGPAAWGSDLIS